MSKEEASTLMEHLEELRDRLIKSVVSILVMFVLGWIFRRDILYVLKKPLLDALPEELRHTILLRVIDKFFIDMKVALIGAVFLATPFIVYQVWRFVAPGLYKHEKRLALPMIFVGGVFFATGVAFGYFFVLPFGFQFLVSYSLDSGGLLALGGHVPEAAMAADKLQVALKEHISFTAAILFAFGLAFETPLFMIILGLTGIVRPEWFARQRKYAIVAIFVFAAMLTPPDPWTQIAFAIPLLFLYELGIWTTRLLNLFSKKRRTETDRDQDSESETDLS